MFSLLMTVLFMTKNILLANGCEYIFVDSDIIDVAALDSQSLEHSDYVDRARQYRSAILWDVTIRYSIHIVVFCQNKRNHCISALVARYIYVCSNIS